MILEKAVIIKERNKDNRKIIIYCNDYFYSILGILGGICAECVVVPASPAYGEKNLQYIMKKLQDFFVVTDDEKMVTNISGDEVIFIKDGTELKENSACNIERINWKRSNREDSTQFILFTSGSTDYAKGVILSTHNVLSNISKYEEYLPLNENDVTLIWRPICHAAVLFREVIYSLLRGCNLVLFNERYIPQRILGYLKKYHCTYLGITPTLLRILIKFSKEREMKYLKYVTVSGERVRVDDLRTMKLQYPELKIFNVYGLTEATLQLTYLDEYWIDIKENSVGKPLKGYEIKIVDDRGEKLNYGLKGEVIAKCESMMSGYYEDDIRTNKKIVDGWLHTGDIGYLDKEGFLYIVGRIDTMIIRSGVNIFPEEIEKVLLDSHIVQDILVYGCDDVNFGQKICVDCVLNNENITLSDFKGHCREVLPAHMQPDEINLVKEICHTANGKTRRYS